LGNARDEVLEVDTLTDVPRPRVFEVETGGKTLKIETGRLARQAGGSVLVTYGNTVVLVTVTASKEPRGDLGFFPLTVDYEERQYALGKIPGNFFRREGRPTEKAILAARLTDRPIRPLFPEGFYHEVQVIVTVLSADHDHPFEIAGLIGASTALSISDIPFHGPVGACVVGRVDGELVINPTAEQMEASDLHLTVAGTRDAVTMVEAGANEVPESVILDAIMLGHQEIRKLVDFIEGVAQEVGKPKMEFTPIKPPEEIEELVRKMATDEIRRAVLNPDKLSREADLDALYSRIKEELLETYPEEEWAIDQCLEKVTKEEVRRLIIEESIRPDGRCPTDIRPITCEVGVLPRAHGAGLFTRGQTQVLTVATLGTVGDVQFLDSLEATEFKRYIHHYNFPPYSVGEVRRLRAPGRREIGHGALAERALEPMLPDEDDFPYTIRLVSEVLESNGSTSMASVCGSTLALMDAGVPIKEPVAGVAMGLIKEGDKVVVLTDIQGMEDFLGDMDFKVAGTRNGVNALQMDIKIGGVGRDILERALAQAREARLFILDKMLQTIPAPRESLSPYAPRIITLHIDPDKIRDVIGPGGKTIHKIIQETDAQIDIEDDGTIFIATTDEEKGQRAVEMIQELVRDVEVGEIYLGTVQRIMTFGAFVEILPGKEGLVHISELTEGRVPTVEDVLKVGDKILVKVTEIDDLGRINLSRKHALRERKNGEAEETRQLAGLDKSNGEPPQPQPAKAQKIKPRHRRPPQKRRRRK